MSDTAEPRPRADPASDAAGSTTGAALLRSGAWLALAQVLPQLFTLIISVAAARFLGPDDMGRQSYITFVSVVASTLAGLGLPLAVQRFVAMGTGAGRRDQVASFAVLGWRWSAAGGLLAAGCVAAVGTRVYPDLHAAWLLAAAIAGLTVVQSTASNILFGLQRFRQATVVGLSMGAVGVVSAVTALALRYGITGMFVAEAASMLVTTVGTLWLSVRGVGSARGTRRRLDRATKRELLRFTALLGAGLVVEFVVAKRSEFVFLERFSTDREIAFYSVAFAAVTAAGRLPSALVQLIMPAVSTLVGAGQHGRIGAGYARAMRLVLTVSLPLAAAAVVLGPLALRTVYGESYAPAGAVLAVLAPVPLLLGPLAAICSATLNAYGRLRAPLLWGFFAMAVTIALDLLLIRNLASIGAALANNGGQLAGTLPLLVLAHRQLRVSWLRWVLLRAAAVCVGAAGLAWGAGALLGATAGGALVALIGATAVGAVSFWLLGRSVGLVDDDDARWLAEALGRRFARAGDLIRHVTVRRT